MNTQQQQNKTVLYISELPENIVDSDLDQFFSAYKDNIILSQVDRSGRSYNAFGGHTPRATIIFKDHEKAAEARNALNMLRLKGKTLNIMWHEKDNTIRYNNTANLFVKGINTTVKPREIYELFMKYGEIMSSKICEDENGNLRGYGYINYYNLDSAEKAIKDLNKKEFKGSILEIEHFQKKNERFNSYMGNNSIYIKNIPNDMTDDNLKNMFSEFGTITWSKVLVDPNKRKFAILVYSTPESAVKAKESLNGKKLPGGEELYVDLLQKKNDRRRLINTKIYDINSKLNQDFKNCNLYIKNIPIDMTDEQFKEAFTKFGEIKSSKIQKTIIETKIKGEFKEILQSSGFGYVCFLSPESAQKAMTELNGKYFPGFENESKPPLIINFFMPKNERTQFLSKVQSDSVSKFPLMMGPPGYPMPYGPGFGTPYGMNYAQQRGPNPKGRHQGPKQHPRQQKEKKVDREDEPNLKHLESLDTIEAQKDYLGEYLFKKIEQHPISHERGLVIDTIGKITGMILGIDDIKEIYDTTVNNDSLTERIQEALKLLEGQQ